MPWQEQDRVSLRHEFVQLASLPGASIAALCRRYAISRKTGYKWLKRYQRDGLEGLADRSRRPHHSPLKTPSALEAQVLAVRREEPVWGGRTIRRILINQGHPEVPSASTITAILHRHGCLASADEVLERQAPFKRFEHPHPNDLWQMDFKGHVGLRLGGRCYPLNIIDDHSRFNIALRALAGERRVLVQQVLIEVFRQYGLPYRMTMDNGKPWGNQFGGYTRLTVWLIRLGIRVSHSRPYHPQTQGKAERFHRTLHAELLSKQPFGDLHESQQAFDWWRERYNLIRPNQAIDESVPVARYRPSPRAYPETLPPFEYAPDDQLRRVGRQGQFSFQGRIYKISEAFAGEHIALRAADKDGELELYYCHQKIGTISLHI